MLEDDQLNRAIRQLWKSETDFSDVILVFYELVARIEALEAKLKEQK